MFNETTPLPPHKGLKQGGWQVDEGDALWVHL